jgi:hypothetical protein
LPEDIKTKKGNKKMSTDKKLSSLYISSETFEKNSIAKMANIPSRPSAFGESSLTPAQVKERFDANPKLIKERFNELLAMLPDLGGELKLTVSVDGKVETVTLSELVASLSDTSGALQMQNILKVTYGGEDKTIKAIVSALTKAVSDNTKEIREIEKSLDGYTEGLEYILSDDGTYYICDGGNIKGDINIPPVYNGLPVKEIGYAAFYGERRRYRLITSVIIPDTVERIESDAFSMQWSLETIIIKGTPKYIGRAFETDMLYEDVGPHEGDNMGVPYLDLYVPFKEGEVPGSPWGTENGTIHYSSTPESVTRARLTKIGNVTKSLENKIEAFENKFEGIPGKVDMIESETAYANDRIVVLEGKVEMLIQGGGGADTIALLNLINEGGLE